LDAALGLGRVGGDVADAAVLQPAAQVGGVLGAGQFFVSLNLGKRRNLDRPVPTISTSGRKWSRPRPSCCRSSCLGLTAVSERRSGGLAGRSPRHWAKKWTSESAPVFDLVTAPRC